MSRIAGMLLTLLLGCLTYAPAVATSAQSIISKLPTEVPEIVTAGNWKHDKKRGTYRAIVVLTGDQKTYAASVFLQWIEVPDKEGKPVVTKTVPITEFNSLGLPTAFISLEPEKDNEMKLLVSSYNPKTDEDLAVEIVADGKGTYKVVSDASSANTAN